jgi:hypothetical protein
MELPTAATVEGMGEPIDLEARRREGVWQLVPEVYDICHLPDNPGEYDYLENGHWQIATSLQMSSADPHHQYDNYNDCTKYRRTGELMEVTFAPIFREGIPNGSSKEVVQKRKGYPPEENVGIESETRHSAKLGMTAAGPSPESWLHFLTHRQDIMKRKRVNDPYPLEHGGARRIARRTLPVAGGANLNVFSAEVSSVDARGDAPEPQRAVSSAPAAPPSSSSPDADIERVQAALQGVGGSAAAPTPARGRGKKASRSTVAAQGSGLVQMPGSYIANSGGGGGEDGAAGGGSGGSVGGGVVGAVRASLISSVSEEEGGSSG